MCTDGEKASKWFIYHCNAIPWCVRGCTLCSMQHTMDKKHNNGMTDSRSCGPGQSSLSPGSINSINTLPLLPGQVQDYCCFILSNSSVTNDMGHIHSMDHRGEWSGFSYSNPSTWHFLAEGSVFVLTYVSTGLMGQGCWTSPHGYCSCVISAGTHNTKFNVVKIDLTSRIGSSYHGEEPSSMF